MEAYQPAGLLSLLNYEMWRSRQIWLIGLVQVLSKSAIVNANDFIIVLGAAETPTMMAQETP